MNDRKGDDLLNYNPQTILNVVMGHERTATEIRNTQIVLSTLFAILNVLLISSKPIIKHSQ